MDENWKRFNGCSTVARGNVKKIDENMNELLFRARNFST